MGSSRVYITNLIWSGVVRMEFNLVGFVWKCGIQQTNMEICGVDILGYMTKKYQEYDIRCMDLPRNGVMALSMGKW